ncbi:MULTISPECIES: ABC transporter permease [unclassified Micromonospora]|uniref:ABC transporter permease n=1 Tax=unclassified Micromonospora TaxID=2617518 RepID=UPI003A8AE7D9
MTAPSSISATSSTASQTPGLPRQRRPRRGPTPDNGPHGTTRTVKVLRIVSPLTLLLAWQIAAQISNSILFPTPTAIVAAAWDLALSGELGPALWRSNQALLIGTSVALAVGVPIGIALGRSPLLNRIFGVYIDIDLATPTIALIPIVIIVFGLGLTARSVVVFLFAFALVVSLVRTGARIVDANLIDMAAAFAPTRWQLWAKVILPGLLPALGGAFRVAVSRGVVGMVIVELTLTTVGIGGLVMEARSFFQADVVYAGVAVVVAEGLLLMALGRWVERKIAPQGLYGTGG